MGYVREPLNIESTLILPWIGLELFNDKDVFCRKIGKSSSEKLLQSKKAA